MYIHGYLDGEVTIIQIGRTNRVGQRESTRGRERSAQGRLASDSI